MVLCQYLFADGNIGIILKCLQLVLFLVDICLLLLYSPADRKNEAKYKQNNIL